MVESIAPVVYGTKTRYRWAVIIHSVAAGLAGAAFGAVLAGVGALLQAPWGTTGKVVVAGAALAYAARELFGLPLPLFDRRQQVPDWWRTFYGPHVAAGLYGAGLGIGFFTFIRYGTYVVVCILAVVSGDVLIGAALGATFGISRGLTTLASTSTEDEVQAADVVERLERTATGNRPRLANGLALVALAVVVTLTSCSVPATSSRAQMPRPAEDLTKRYSAPQVLGRILDRSIKESSGLVASRANDGVLWTHNDSGDGPYLYAIDMRGRTLGRWLVTGAKAFDWEAIAIGPHNHLYIGDIGDNNSTRSSITVYRVPEPEPRSDGRATDPATAIDITYPNGPHDAEALMVHPATGDLYVVTKELTGRAVLYRARAPLESSVELERLGPVNLPATYGGVTAGDISPLGDRMVLATYLGAYEWTIANGGDDFDGIWDSRPVKVNVGARPQGESIAYDISGTSILTTSEGLRSRLTIVRSDTS